MSQPSPALLVAMLLGAAVVGCGNPVPDKRIETLGPEIDGVEPGEFHRPGQPCVLCHSTYEGASPELSVGGTVFATPRRMIPVEKAVVTLTDSLGESRSVPTNCIGNFFITKEDWDPTYPLKAEIAYPVPGSDPPEVKGVTMESRINRDGSCAGCHVGTRNQGSPGWVFCVEEQPGPDGSLGTADDVFPPFPPPAASCAGKLPTP